MIKKILVEVEEELKKKFSVKCARQGKTKKEVLTRLVTKWVAQ